jgi:hypothetical protein
MPANSVVDGRFRLLHLLHPGRGTSLQPIYCFRLLAKLLLVSNIDLGKTSSIQPSHSHHHLLLGSRMPLYGIR